MSNKIETENKPFEGEERKLVELELKSQTIYYENSTGEIVKYYHISNKRVNLKDAEQVLIDNGINVSLVLRTITERVLLPIDAYELQNSINHSERFYQSNQ